MSVRFGLVTEALLNVVLAKVLAKFSPCGQVVYSEGRTKCYVFARILGISQAQLSKYEKAQSVPTVEILLKLKAFSGKTVDWILTGE